MVNQSNNLQHLITGGGTRNTLSFTAFFPPFSLATAEAPGEEMGRGRWWRTAPSH